MSSPAKASRIAVAVNVIILVGLVNGAYTAGLREGRRAGLRAAGA
jgi:hypothetical protein